MARYIGPVCRLCRREGMKLFLKGERCYTEKCAIEKRNFAPGQHGKTRKSKLERRLDNVAYRLGFATSRPQARQLVRHGHFTVNGKKVDIPSFSVKPGDIVAVRQTSQKAPAILHALEEVKGRGVPEWLQFDAAALSGKIGSVPTREQINLPVQEQLIVELYSK
jgi:small subunit ribosomal protein S4